MKNQNGWLLCSSIQIHLKKVYFESINAAISSRLLNKLATTFFLINYKLNANKLYKYTCYIQISLNFILVLFFRKHLTILTINFPNVVIKLGT